jgi:uncharacterized protein DUF5670
MLWTIFVVLGILWLLGFSLHVGGGLIHLLLVVALVILVINLLSGRRGVGSMKLLPNGRQRQGYSLPGTIRWVLTDPRPLWLALP